MKTIATALLLIALAAPAHATIVDNSLNICAALRQGTPLTDIETVLVERGFNPHDAGTFTGTTIRESCPDEVPSVLEQLR